MRPHLRRLAPLGSVIAALLLAGLSCAPPPSGMPAENDFPATSTPKAAEPASPPGGGVEAQPQARTFFVAPAVLSFNHVEPGVRSEFYVDLQASVNPPVLEANDANAPGPVVTLTLSGPGVMGEKSESHPFEAGQNIRFSWDINRFGTYRAEGGIYVGSELEFPISEQLKVQ